MERKGTGLVFAGGGGKGGYEIGVWKYLHEIELDKYICAVSGTSVGALNAALFVGGSFEKAEKLWSNINESQILTQKKIEVEDVIKWFALHHMPLKIGLKLAAPLAGVATDVNAWATKISALYFDSFFSRDGLIELIDNGIDFEQFQNSNVECFATCLQIPNFSVERFRLGDYNYDELKTLLLASSAIPVLFEPEIFKGKQYIDGGIPLAGDNVPIEPLYNYGVEYIIVVHLNRHTFIDKKLYPHAKIIEIVPSENLGDLIKGTMDFTATGAEERIELGYRDAKKTFAPLIKMLQLTQERKSLYEEFRRSMDSFNAKKMEHDEEVRHRQGKENSDGFEEVMKELGV